MPVRVTPLVGLGATIAVAIAVAAVLAVTGWRAEHFRDGDFIQYWVAGRALLSGADVYDPLTWRALHDAIGSGGYEIAPGLGFLYPLPVALYALPIALLPLQLAGPLWFVAEGATAFGALVAIGRQVFTWAPRRDLPLLLVLAVVMVPVYVIGNDGNIARFLVGIVGGALALLIGGRTFAAGLVLGLAGVKPQLFVVLVPLLVVVCPPQTRGRFVAGGLTTILASLVVTVALRPGWIAEWLTQALQARGGYGRLNVWAVFVGGTTWIAVVLLVCALSGLVWWWRATRPSIDRSASAALGLSLIFAPYASDYDLAVLLVGVPAVLATVAPFPPPWRAALIVVLVATSPVLTVFAAFGLLDQAVLFVPPVALTALVVGTQLLAARAGLAGSASLDPDPPD